DRRGRDRGQRQSGPDRPREVRRGRVGGGWVDAGGHPGEERRGHERRHAGRAQEGHDGDRGWDQREREGA
ncbi:hypothetical protein LTR53_020302, partial [Teratosphaeriaceae sp. CCFEE 6253]